MDFPVPQFIEVEEKILGPLTLKQTLYLVGAAGVIFILYFFMEMWLFIILSAVIFGTAASFAFIKIGGRSLGQFLSSVIIYSFAPRLFIWKKTEKTHIQKIELEKTRDASEANLEKSIRQEMENKSSGGLKEISKRIDLGIKTKRLIEDELKEEKI